MNVCIYGAASDEIASEYIEKTYELSSVLAKRGHSLVFGGGAHGLMGAAARGFYDNSAPIYGVVPEFFNVDGILFDGCTELIRTPTMRTRKQKMDDLAQAFVTAPGGVGTFEEFFEIITLKQLGQSKKPLVLFNINGYFEPLRALLRGCVDGGFMPENTLLLCRFSDSIGEIADYIENYTLDDIDITEYRNITKD